MLAVTAFSATEHRAKHDAAYVTGAIIPVDGGLNIGSRAGVDATPSGRPAARDVAT